MRHTGSKCPREGFLLVVPPFTLCFLLMFSAATPRIRVERQLVLVEGGGRGSAGELQLERVNPDPSTHARAHV